MNKLWIFLITFGIGFGIITGRVENVSNAILDSCKKSIELLFSIGGIMIVWTGIMNIGQESGLIRAIAKALSPFIKKLFPSINPKGQTAKYIVMNFSANLLGLGNAATPFGIKAMDEMRKNNINHSHISRAMMMFLIINISSLQLIPTTVIAIRRDAGSTNPAAILPAVWISSATATIVGILLVIAFSKRLKERGSMLK